MNDGDRGTKLGEEVCLLHGGVPSPDDNDGFVFEEEAVAGGAGGDAETQVFLFTLDAKVARGCTRRDNDCSRLVFLPLGPDDLDVAGQVHALDHVLFEFSAEALGLLAHLLHE